MLGHDLHTHIENTKGIVGPETTSPISRAEVNSKTIGIIDQLHLKSIEELEWELKLKDLEQNKSNWN